jgi:hypothetical protein
MFLKIILCLTAISCLTFTGCVSGPLDHHTEELVYEQGKLQKYSYKDDTYGEKSKSSAFLEAVDTIKQVDPMALPELQDLPLPSAEKPKKARAYTGIIKNKTKYDLSVPSANSGATLPLPASGWIEYTAWSKHIDVTAYHEGKPFYCLKIHANPKNYAFMCKKYDFVAEIVKAEPVRKAKPVRKKRPVRKKPKGAEVEGLGFMGQRSQPLL